MKIKIYVLICTALAAQLTFSNSYSQGFVGMPGQKLIGENSLLSPSPLFVGIGYNNPLYSLHIDNSSSSPGCNLALTGHTPIISFETSNLVTLASAHARMGLCTSTGDMVTTSSPNDFVLQTNYNPAGSLIFGTSATTTGNERMRIKPNGYIGMNTGSTVTDQLHILLNPAAHVRIQNMPATTATTMNPVVIDAAGRLWEGPASGSGALAWLLHGNTLGPGSTDFMGSIDAQDVVFKSTNTERMRITSGGTIGINTASSPDGTPSPTYKLQVWNSKADSHVGVSGTSPTVRFSDKIDNIDDITTHAHPVINSTVEAEIGLTTEFTDLVHFAIPGDMVMRNESKKNSIIFATGTQINHCPSAYSIVAGAEKVRIDSNGFLGINTVNHLATEFTECNILPNYSGVKDRVDIVLGTTGLSSSSPYPPTYYPPMPNLATQEYVRIENMPIGGTFNVMIDNVGRLYRSANAAPPVPVSPLTAEEASKLKSEVAELQNQLVTVSSKLNDLVNCCANSAAATTAKTDGVIAQNSENVLYQNTPNPFSNVTTIGYFIGMMNSNAAIMITDMNGKQLSKYPINQTGQGSITLKSENMVAGMYLYALIVDGAVVDTKKMVINAQ